MLFSDIRGQKETLCASAQRCSDPLPIMNVGLPGTCGPRLPALLPGQWEPINMTHHPETLRLLADARRQTQFLVVIEHLALALAPGPVPLYQSDSPTGIPGRTKPERLD